MVHAIAVFSIVAIIILEHRIYSKKNCRSRFNWIEKHKYSVMQQIAEQLQVWPEFAHTHTQTCLANNKHANIRNAQNRNTR